MDKETAINNAGSVQKLAELLGIKHQAIYAWGKKVPLLRLYQLKELCPEWFTRKGRR